MARLAASTVRTEDWLVHREVTEGLSCFSYADLWHCLSVVLIVYSHTAVRECRLSVVSCLREDWGQPTWRTVSALL